MSISIFARVIVPFLYLSSVSVSLGAHHNSSDSNATEWIVANLLKGESKEVDERGNPKLADSPYGEAVQFDGESDALFIEGMPLKSMKEFTVEMIFNPDSDNAPFEQRILHIGEVSEDRMLLEIRAVDGKWYFDGFVASKENGKALIDPNLTHPLGEWHHVAFVVGPERLSTYVNGKKELSAPFAFEPIETGRTSIGVRQNIRSWFKGRIFKIRITPAQLEPAAFLSR